MPVTHLCILFILLFTSIAGAKEKYLVLLGGGGEPAGKTTIFDPSLQRMGDFSRAHPEYKLDISFNGGHLETERIIRDNFQNSTNNSFTSRNFENTISKYEKMIESGKIKAGDNLLIAIDSHGSTQSGDSHNISTTGETMTDFENLGSKTVSLDRLKKLTLLAEDKGVNLGIIDLSCYSGNTLALANSKTCVISGAGTEHVGLASPSSSYFSNRLPQFLSTASNLEEAFLKARKESIDISYPMISTLSGQVVQQIHYQALGPYLNFQSQQSSSRFTDFMEEDFLQGKTCHVEQGLNQLNSIVQNFIKSSEDLQLKMALFQLQHEVKSYHDFIDSIKTEMRKAGIGMMKKKLDFCATIPADDQLGVSEVNECVSNFNLQSLAKLNFQPIYDFYQKKSKDMNLSPKERAKNLALYQCYKKMEGWRNHVLRANPQFLLIDTFWQDRYPYLSTQTKRYAEKVIAAEKQVYDLLYHQMASNGPNPCRAFEL